MACRSVWGMQECLGHAGVFGACRSVWGVCTRCVKGREGGIETCNETQLRTDKTVVWCGCTLNKALQTLS